MSRLIAPHHLATAHLVLSALILIWDLSTAGRIAKLRATPRLLAFLSALAGLLLVPALTVLLVSNSLLSGRTLSSIEWVWSVTTLLIAAQAIYVVARRLAATPIGVSIAAYDVLVALISISRYLVSIGVPVGTPLLALVAAQRGALAFSAQPLALLMPWYLYLPIIAPATSPRRGAQMVLRTALAALAAAWGTLVLVDLPAAARAVRSYDRYAAVRLQERPDSDFAIGVKIFPTLSGAPSQLSLQSDLPLADSIGAEALSVYLSPAGTSLGALDSLAHSLEESRGDKVLIVALDLSGEHALPPAARGRYFRARVADVERIARRLRPEYIVPVIDPNGGATRALGRMSVDTWITYLRDAARSAHAADPKVRVMVHVGGFGARDSALYVWASRASAGVPVDAIGISLFPWLGGADALDARMRAADRWLRAGAGPAGAPATPKEHWVLEAGGFPVSHGDRAQMRALRGALAWATSRSAVKGLIVYEASDYEAPVGLRAPGGRVRPAAAMIRQAVISLGGS